MVDIDADPVLDGNDLFAVSFQGQIAALDPRNGEILWQREMSSHAGLAVDATAVYVTDESSHVWALDRRSGSTLWKQTDLQHRRLTAPVVQGRYVVVGDFEGYLHWLSKDDGRIVGRLQVDDDGIAAAPVTASDTLYYLGRGGRVGAVTIR